MSSSHCKNKMRLKDKKLLIFSTINCFLFVIFFLKSGGYYLTENSSVETSIVDIVNTTPAPIVVKTTKQVIPAYTGDVIANDLYQKYLGKIFLILYTVQLIEHPILQIPNFNFPNLRCSHQL